MRRFIILFAWLSTITLTSCDVFSEQEVDWMPVEVKLKVIDEQGTDLLDPENPNNMIDGTTITYKGQTYAASRERWDDWLWNNLLETRAILAQIHGLFLMRDDIIGLSTQKGFTLLFGDIDGAKDMDEDLVVTLPNGDTGIIHYHCSNHNERKLKCDRTWTFNGKKTDGKIFTFVVSN